MANVRYSILSVNKRNKQTEFINLNHDQLTKEDLPQLSSVQVFDLDKAVCEAACLEQANMLKFEGEVRLTPVTSGPTKGGWCATATKVKRVDASPEASLAKLATLLAS